MDAIEKKEADAEIVQSDAERILALQERQLALQERQMQLLETIGTALHALVAQAQEPRGRAGAEAAALRDRGVRIRGGSIPLADFANEGQRGEGF